MCLCVFVSALNGKHVVSDADLFGKDSAYPTTKRCRQKTVDSVNAWKIPIAVLKIKTNNSFCLYVWTCVD